MVSERSKPGSKHEREKLRHDLLALGRSLKQIADDMARLWGFRPRQAWRYANGMTQEEVARQYNELNDDPQAKMTGKRISDYEVWPNGGQMPPLHVLLTLSIILGANVHDLLDAEDLYALPRSIQTALGPEPELSRPDLTRSSNRRGTGTDSGTRAAPDGVGNDPALDRRSETHLTESAGGAPLTAAAFRNLVLAAADESRRHAERAELSVMAQATLEKLTEDVTRLSREHLYINSTELFGETLRTRNRVYRLLEEEQYPRDKTQLYYLASILCCLLSDTSSSVGFSHAAGDLAHAAFAYGEIIGHNGLRVWSRTMLASLAYWSDRPRRAYDLNLSCKQWASDNVYQLQVVNGEALFEACMGRRDEALRSLYKATELRESVTGRNELFDGIGGMFDYSHAKQLQIATMAWVQLAEYEKASASAEQALELYRSGLPEMRAFGNEASASIDWARCSVLAGELDAAEERLTPVLALPPGQRQEWFLQRLRSLLRELSVPRYTGSSTAESLAETIEDFCAITAKDEFPHEGA